MDDINDIPSCKPRPRRSDHEQAYLMHQSSIATGSRDPQQLVSCRAVGRWFSAAIGWDRMRRIRTGLVRQRMNETVRATTIAEYRRASESFIVVSCRAAPEPEWGESEYQELLGPRAPPGRVPGVEQFATALGSILHMDRAISICLHLACVWPTTPCSEQQSCKVHTRSVRPLAQ